MLKEYIAPISDSINLSHKTICKNQALDAIANHYDEIAKCLINKKEPLGFS